MSSTTCPKCNYTRKPTDTVPDWQCPSCGIVYAKFQPAGAAQAAAQASGRSTARDLRKRAVLAAGQGDKPGSTALFVYGGLLLFLLLAYTQLHQINWLKIALPVFVVSSFLFWLSAYRRKRMIEDVPTSTIAAAAQGYVELQGTVAPATGHSLTARLTGAPCAWFLYVIKEKDKQEMERRAREDTDSGKMTIRLGGPPYVEVDRGSSAVSFILRDKTGACLVEGSQAEIVCDRYQEWEEGDHRYEEWSIRVGDAVHAIGQFTTGSTSAESQTDLKVAYALASEQRDAAAFAERYDTNRDGKVDAQELAVARGKAREQAAQRNTNQGGTHSLGASPDGRPFLVISGGQQRATTHYGWLAAAHLCVFFLSLAALTYLMI